MDLIRKQQQAMAAAMENHDFQDDFNGDVENHEFEEEEHHDFEEDEEEEFERDRYTIHHSPIRQVHHVVKIRNEPPPVDVAKVDLAAHAKH